MTTSSHRSPHRLALIALALLVTALAARPLAAQQGRPRPPLLRATAALGWGIASELANSGVSTGSIRVEVPVTSRVAPWASWTDYQLALACIPEAASCPANGNTWLVGVMLDASGPRRSMARPFLGAGVGRWRVDQESGTAHSAVFGVAIEAIPVVAPRVELRAEKYPPFGEQLIIGVGVQLTVPRPRLRNSS